MLTARRQGRLDAVAAGLGEQATVAAGDLRDPAVRSAVVDLAASRFGRLDILVNNAGTCDGGPLRTSRSPTSRR